MVTQQGSTHTSFLHFCGPFFVHFFVHVTAFSILSILPSCFDQRVFFFVHVAQVPLHQFTAAVLLGTNFNSEDVAWQPPFASSGEIHRNSSKQQSGSRTPQICLPINTWHVRARVLLIKINLVVFFYISVVFATCIFIPHTHKNSFLLHCSVIFHLFFHLSIFLSSFNSHSLSLFLLLCSLDLKRIHMFSRSTASAAASFSSSAACLVNSKDGERFNNKKDEKTISM